MSNEWGSASNVVNESIVNELKNIAKSVVVETPDELKRSCKLLITQRLSEDNKLNNNIVNDIDNQENHLENNCNPVPKSSEKKISDISNKKKFKVVKKKILSELLIELKTYAKHIKIPLNNNNNKLDIFSSENIYITNFNKIYNNNKFYYEKKKKKISCITNSCTVRNK